VRYYAGAGSLLSPDDGLRLDPSRWGWQPKIDGLYAHVYTDERGVVERVHSRTGRSLSEARSLVGCALGIPSATIAGEFEGGTEAGIRAAEARGWSAFHMFDALRLYGRDVMGFAALTRHRLLEHGTGDQEALDWWWRDAFGAAHDPHTGRFVRAVPDDARRFPLVPMARRMSDAETMWSAVECGMYEGLVAVDLGAHLGKRGAKRKIKATETLDCVVVSVAARAAIVAWSGHTFAVSHRGEDRLQAGEIVEVAANGFYEHARKGAPVVPRFARLVRRRVDK